MCKPDSYGRRVLYESLRLCFCSIALLPCLLGISALGGSGQVSFAKTLTPPVYTISGTVFDDYNQNGTQDAREPGINGVVVTAYNSAGSSVGTATSSTVNGTLGQYTITLPGGTGAVRVQFSNFGTGATLPSLTIYQPSSHVAPPVQFVSGANSANTVNFGLEYPSEYCQNNPNMATSCYVRGDQTDATAHVIVRFPYNNSGNNTPPTGLATAPDVGATWGLAYRRSSDDLFAGAYTKQMVNYKPSGSTGAIYIIHHADNSPSVSATPFVDLNALFGANTAGANTHTTTNNYVPDLSAYDAVGKTALGGMALSDDESTLYVMNLADRNLYGIPIGAAPNAPTAPAAVAITHTIIPSPADCPSDVRPFAVTAYRGLIYVGAVCSAESTITQALPHGDPTKLKAYVFVYTPGTGFTAAPLFETPLNYTRHCSNGAFNNANTCTTTASALWRAWQPNSTQAYAVGNYSDYPQPILSGIAFDNGDLILGLRDRYGDQTGHNVPGLPDGITGGDTLRACLNTAGNFSSGWTLENNGVCGATTITAGQNNGKGPGGGQYYYQQYFQPYHDYVSQGGLAQVPGFPGVMSITFDPTTDIDSGGTRTYTNANGTKANGYEIFQNNTPNTFGKANGLGDLTAFCQSAPIELGDRVWFDSNGNGIQDANEPGIANVTVHLYAADGTTLLQTTTTDANGNYVFTISPYTSYVIKLNNAADYASNGPLHAYQLTTPNEDSSTHSTDSKGVLPAPAQPLGNGNYPQIMVGNHNPGQNDYNQDFGFSAFPDLSITKIHAGSGAFLIGQTASYTLQVTDKVAAGPVVIGQPITVNDTIPSGLSNVTADGGSSWNISGSSTITATYTGSYPVIPGANLAPITISGTLTNAAAPALANSATVTTPLDSNPSNNTSTDTLTISSPPDLTLSLTHPNSTCSHVGQTVTSTLTVSNLASAGPVPANQLITVSDTLPAGLNNVSASGTGWTTSISGSTLTGTYPSNTALLPGASLPAITIIGTISNPPGLSLTNSATVTTANDSNVNNNATSDTIAVCGPDLALTKLHLGTGPFQVGQTISYTLAVSNGNTAGPIFAGEPITITDAVPTSVSNPTANGTGWSISQTSSPNGTTILATYTGNYPVATGATLPMITVTGTMNNAAAPTLANSATVSTPGDTNPANDTSTDIINVAPQPDLTIALTHQGSTCSHVGQMVTSTLTVSNLPSAGPVLVGQIITVTDTLPAGLSNVTATGTGWSTTLTGTTLTATRTVNTLLAAGTILPTITITGTISTPDSLSPVNSATVSTPTDGNVSNNTASDTLQVCGPDLTIVKTHQGGNRFKVGQTITYNLQVSNAATGGPIFHGEPVTVTDTLPRGIDSVQAHGNGWHIKLTSTRWTTTVVATYAGSYPIASGAHFPVIIVTGKLTNDATGSLNNSASVATPLDRNGSNNTGNTHIVVERQPDLSVSMNHNAAGCAKIKQQITYQVQVHVLPDSGPIERDVPITVIDAVPNGLQSIVARGSGWQVRLAPGRGTTQVIATYRRNADLDANATLPPLLINATVSNYSDRPLLSMARVDVAGDSNPANNSARDLLSICHRPPTLPPTGSNPDTWKGLVPFRKFRLR